MTFVSGYFFMFNDPKCMPFPPFLFGDKINVEDIKETIEIAIFRKSLWRQQASLSISQNFF